ncbi:MAG TPA: hypothetical protein ENF25_02560 [Thermoprotei archaeon]|nr:hypothetical protein [Thermoprotei archaeon]
MLMWKEINLIKVEGSRKHPITRGFLGSKGYSLPKLMHHKDRGLSVVSVNLNGRFFVHKCS